MRTIIALACLFVAACSAYVANGPVEYEFMIPCHDCNGKKCDKPYQFCKYGTFVNYCGHRDCFKGPDETCRVNDYLSRCADGLTCRCGVCRGCALRTRECDISPGRLCVEDREVAMSDGYSGPSNNNNL